MVNYLLLFISVVLFLAGIKFIPAIQKSVKSSQSLKSLLVSFYIFLCLLFFVADSLTQNGADNAFIYFIRDSFIGIGLFKASFYILSLIALFIAIYLGTRAYISKSISGKTASGAAVGHWLVLFIIFAAFVIHPFTVGMGRSIYSEDNQLPNKKYDTDQFIAHAGGSIDGIVYTNSLEALNNSYRNGFRLFELDMLKTSDGIFVAAHDWDGWKAMTGYKGEIPPKHSDFKKNKLLGKYTSLDINDINSWFLAHQDAVLVTDKVDSPGAFAKLFAFPERLMMELFTMESLVEASQSKMRSAMPTWDLLAKIEGDKLSTLQDLGVTDIAASRTVIKWNIPFMRELMKNGIRVYVFHVNYDKGKDEDYVLSNDMAFVYGMYADEFNIAR